MWFVVSSAWAYDGVPQWDDPILDRTPREQTVGLSQGLVFGETGLGLTRLHLGLTPYSTERSGLGVTMAAQVSAGWVASESRGGVGFGGAEAAVHVWFTPRKRTRTSHDVYAGGTVPIRTTSYLVRVDDVVLGARAGYSGYYDVFRFLDLSLDLRIAAGVLPESTDLEVFPSGNVTAYVTNAERRWAILGAVDVSRWTTAVVLGARARFGGAWEAGAAAVVPLRLFRGGEGELPVWPTVDAQARF